MNLENLDKNLDSEVNPKKNLGELYDEIESKLEELSSYSEGAKEKAKELEKQMEDDEDPENFLKKVQYYIDRQKENQDLHFPQKKNWEEGLLLKNLDQEEKQELEEKMRQIAKEAINKKWEEIGRGYTAQVFVSKVDDKYCFKIITNPEEYQKGNDVKREVEFLDKVENLDLEESVRVPEPCYYFMSQESHLYVMEKLEAVSLDEVLTSKKDLPDKFDFDSFFKDLGNFVEKMNENRIYHRDLHEGNIMIDQETGKPRVIDFGKSKMNESQEEAFKDKDPRGKETVYLPDQEKIKEVKIRFKNFLNNQ